VYRANCNVYLLTCLCVCQTFECDYASQSQVVVDSQQQQQHYAGAEYTSSSVLLQRTGDLALPIDCFDSTLSVVYHFLLQATCPCLMCTGYMTVSFLLIVTIHMLSLKLLTTFSLVKFILVAHLWPLPLKLLLIPTKSSCSALEEPANTGWPI